MSRVGTEVVVIALLLLANGVFAMAELAVVSSRKTRLQQRAEAGDAGARRALELAKAPNRFLSTVQVGITLIGIFAGAFGGATLTRELAGVVARWPALAPYAHGIALVLVVLTITYFSLVIGELVPKRIALNAPERIAAAVAGPMHALSIASTPLVKLLSLSTEGMLRLLRVKKHDEPPVTEEEIAVLLEQGAQAGVFEEAEQDLVENVFWLGDQRVAALMTPRHRVVWLDVQDPPEEHRRVMLENPRSRYIVAEGDVDHVIGMVATKDLWTAMLRGEPADLRAHLSQPIFVPESTRALRVLETFRQTGTHLALVVDEYGGIEGLVTLTDLVEEIVGELSSLGGAATPGAVQREDGTWLVDASLAMEEVRELLELPERRAEDRGDYHTLGGFVLAQLGRIPAPADAFEADGVRYEVVDMDGKRIDKVLITPPHPGPAVES